MKVEKYTTFQDMMQQGIGMGGGTSPPPPPPPDEDPEWSDEEIYDIPPGEFMKKYIVIRLYTLFVVI